MTLIEYLRKDEELVKMRKEWKNKTNESFPPFNNDEYNDIQSYKEKIKEKLNNKERK